MIQPKQKIFFQINKGEKIEVMEVDGKTPFNLLTITEFPTKEQIDNLNEGKHYLFMFQDKEENQFKITSQAI